MLRIECMNLSDAHGQHQGQERHPLQEIQRMARPVRDARLCSLNTDIYRMEYSYNKISNMSSFNVMCRGYIIAGADVHPHPYSEKDYIMEIVPFMDESEKAGIILKPEEQWDDFFDSEEEGDELTWEEQAGELLKTIFKGYAEIHPEITIQKRKEVWDLNLSKNGIEKSLRMVREYDRFVNSDGSFEAALYVHDLEEFDIWRFDIDADDQKILDVVYPALKAIRKRLQ